MVGATERAESNGELHFAVRRQQSIETKKFGTKNSSFSGASVVLVSIQTTLAPTVGRDIVMRSQVLVSNNFSVISKILDIFSTVKMEISKIFPHCLRFDFVT